MDKKVVDLASFFLCEVTGDSEADSDLNNRDDDPTVDGDDDHEEDAASCSCDQSDINSRVLDFDDAKDDDDEDDVRQKFCLKEEEEEDEDDDLVTSSSCGSSCFMGGSNKRAKVCVGDSLVNERENDRLFWEACLAS